MPPRVQQTIGERFRNFFMTYKRDLFFAGIAAMALGMVARRELMANGVIAQPRHEDPTKLHVERPKRDKSSR